MLHAIVNVSHLIELTGHTLYLREKKQCQIMH
jgi:hypothetical protein